MQVKDVMTGEVRVIAPHSTLQEAADTMRALDVGFLPVCDGERLVGMVTDRDITVRATAAGSDIWETRVRDVMTQAVIYCYEDQDVAVAARLMKEKQVRRLVVLNRDKRLVGVLSLDDVAVKTGDEMVGGNTLEGVAWPAEPQRPVRR